MTGNYYFDMGSKEYLNKIKMYPNISDGAASIKSDKEAFSNYYAVDLSQYKDERNNFILPYEMSDLYCLMMNVMKSSPTYDARRKDSSISLSDIIDHNKEIIKSLDNLPIYLVECIKMTPEYTQALFLINFMPVILERVSKLLQLAIETTEIPSIEVYYDIIECLDDVYESYFWKKGRKESVDKTISQNKEFFKFFTGIDYDDTTNSAFFHLLDYKLANLFKELDRSCWSAENYKQANDVVIESEDSFKSDVDKDSKVKDEYLFWLCNQDWHILSKIMHGPTRMSSLTDVISNIETKLGEYARTYQKYEQIHPGYLGDGDCSNTTARTTERIASELSIIKQTLQNGIDIILVSKLSQNVESTQDFNQVFEYPYCMYLSNEILMTIEYIISQEAIDNRQETLQFYLEGTLEILHSFDNKYTQYGLSEYIDMVLSGEDMYTCAQKVYSEVYVKIQTQKCDRYNKDNSIIFDHLNSGTGIALNGLIKKDMPRNRKTKESVVEHD